MASRKSIIIEVTRILLPLIIIALGIGGFVAIGGRQPPPPRTDTDQGPPLVQTVPVGTRVDKLKIEVDGVVVPHREVRLAAEVSGRITYKSKDCRPGRYVNAGRSPSDPQLLVRIDQTQYQLEVERLTRELKQAEGNLAELDVEEKNTQSMIALAEEEVRLQEKLIGRLRQLTVRRAAGAEEVDQARRNLLTAKNGAQGQRNQLRLLQVRRNRLKFARDVVKTRLDQAKRDLKHTEIYAPVEGVVITSDVEENSYVQPGTLIAVIEDTSAVEVRCSFLMEELAWLWRSEHAQTQNKQKTAANLYQLPRVPVEVVYTLLGQEYIWDGQLARYDGIGLEEKTRTVPCRILVSNPRTVRTGQRKVPSERPVFDPQKEYPTQNASRDTSVGPKALVRGMFVTIRVRPRPRTPLMRVPERALRPGSVVWRVRDGKLGIVPVQVARIVEQDAIIEATDALLPTDHVVVSPLAVVTEGMRVKEKG